MLAIAERAGGRIVNRDRMWHYTEGIKNWNPIWPEHGIRILPGPSSVWLDATGKRLPVPYLPGFDTLGTLKAILKTGYDYSWFILTQKIVEKEFALSGSEQNPDLTEKNLKEVIRQRVLPGPPDPVKAFLDHGEDFVIADTLPELVEGMNRLTGETCWIRRRSNGRSGRGTGRSTIPSPRICRLPPSASPELYRGSADAGGQAAQVARSEKRPPHRGAPAHPHPEKPWADSRRTCPAGCWTPRGNPVPGLYAAGEVAGFGGGGVHGYRALEGTFLGGCLFTGRQAGRALAKALS